ncbi:hypothetical protein GDO81_011840 [Engystomops pustulosus]|uniref:Uncharacterized protein n=1 Tax=Engystomops pustulosus TaxID=76066 RepID=A0AAV7BH59_ENGPU|nr:hypothetical protein GDO81_011840 [Engystomops pustulosus]
MSPPLLETFLRMMITLSAGSAIVLSSLSLGDGRWVTGAGWPLLGLWGSGCGAVLVRTSLTLAVVLAILGLALLMVSQLCEDGRSGRRWCAGAVLLLAFSILSAAGTLSYVFILQEASGAFTLTFWCQHLGTFLFLLNGASGLYLNHLRSTVPAEGGPERKPKIIPVPSTKV